MKISSFITVKVLAGIVSGVVLVGGATAVFAATPAGQHVFHTVSASTDATKTPNADHQHQGNSSKDCAGQPDAQRLAAKFSLKTASKSDDMQAICSLHSGAFTGTTPGGSSVSSSRVFGYGEIDMLLTYAQYLAAHDKTHAGTQLTSDNARSYLAQALQGCGTTPLEKCLKANIPGYQPGNGGDNGNGNGKGNGNGNGHGNGGGKPEDTPTPHA